MPNLAPTPKCARTSRRRPTARGPPPPRRANRAMVRTLTDAPPRLLVVEVVAEQTAVLALFTAFLEGVSRGVVR